MSTIGVIHTIFSVVALIAGAAVVMMQKGTRWHRTVGHVYLTSMLALNISALFIYRLFGRFGPFHALAVYSLIIIVIGMVPVLTRRPKGRWLTWHAAAISGSYVGLVAAFFAEITSRLPGTEQSFGSVVTVTSVIINAVGFFIIFAYLPKIDKRLPARFRAGQRS
jgi:uncharacterized membrane protein